jgi:hypothetical protein
MEVSMAKETRRFSVTLPNPMYRRAKMYAARHFGGRIGELVRVALAEYIERHYDEKVIASVDWGGWREREDDDEGQRAAVSAT